MFDFHRIALGTLIFVASAVMVLNKVSVKRKQPKLVDLKVAQTFVLVDFRLPEGRYEIAQDLANEEIVLNYLLGGNAKKYFICIHASKNCSQTQILNYISRLYSKIWNEAAQRKMFDIECFIFSDGLNGSITRQTIVNMPELTHMIGYNTALFDNVSAIRWLNSLQDVKFTDVSKDMQDLMRGFDEQPSVVMLDLYNCNQPNIIPVYRKIAIGGTFDSIHFGHLKLLTMAALSCADCLVVGVTSDTMLSKKSNAALIAKYSVGSEHVSTFLSFLKLTVNVQIVELHDEYGPTILVSSETIRGAFKINEIRLSKGMAPLAVLVTYRTDSAILSSSFLRENRK